MLSIEQQFWDDDCRVLAGIDEAGRGPLAGSVVAAAVVLEPELANTEVNAGLSGLTDSKKLTALRREHYFDLLQSFYPRIQIGVGVATPLEIDEINILQATYVAMARAVRALPVLPDHAIVDGRPVQGLPCSSTAVIKGDAKSLSIAAASVVAKVLRDRELVHLDSLYPAYGFASHKGYGSHRHMQALLEHGPCVEHRQSFRPVREARDIRRRSAPEFRFMEE